MRWPTDFDLKSQPNEINNLEHLCSTDFVPYDHVHPKGSQLNAGRPPVPLLKL